MTASPPPDRLRLFIAAALPPEATGVVARLIARLRDAGLAGLRTADPAGVHLTLKFLGGVERDRVEALAAALTTVGEETAPFTLRLEGVGGFPDLRAPRVLWAGVAGDTGALAALARQVDAACAALGHPPERRPFSPHLTIARLRDAATPDHRRRAGNALAAAHLTPATIPVDRVHLIHSTLTPTGPVYRALHTAPLGGARAPCAAARG